MDNILITSGGGLWVSKLTKLLTSDFNIFLSDYKKIKKPPSVKKIFKIEISKKKKFIKDLKLICINYKINFLLPSSDEEAITLSKEKKLFEKITKTKILISDYKILRKFKYKHEIYKILNKGINSFSWHVAKNKKKLIKILKIYKNKDFVIKPSTSRGGRDIFIFKRNIKKKYSKNKNREKYFPHNSKLINKNISKIKFKFPIIVMDCLLDPIYDLDILAFKGKLIQFAIRQRIGVQGYKGNIVKKFNNKYFTLAQKISKKLNLSWLFDFDIMHDLKGKPQILEINPRQSGSIFNSIKAGHPFYESLISITKKKNHHKFFKLSRDKKFVY